MQVRAAVEDPHPIYIGNYEVYRERVNDELRLERQALWHAERIALAVDDLQRRAAEPAEAYADTSRSARPAVYADSIGANPA